MHIALLFPGHASRENCLIINVKNTFLGILTKQKLLALLCFLWINMSIAFLCLLFPFTNIPSDSNINLTDVITRFNFFEVARVFLKCFFEIITHYIYYSNHRPLLMD